MERIAIEGYRYASKKAVYYEAQASKFKAVLDVIGVNPDKPTKRNWTGAKKRISTFANVVYNCLNNNGPQTAKQIGEYFKQITGREISRAGCASQLSALSKKEGLITWIDFKLKDVEGSYWWVYQSWLNDNGTLKPEWVEKIKSPNKGAKGD